MGQRSAASLALEHVVIAACQRGLVTLCLGMIPCTWRRTTAGGRRGMHLGAKGRRWGHVAPRGEVPRRRSCRGRP